MQQENTSIHRSALFTWTPTEACLSADASKLVVEQQLFSCVDERYGFSVHSATTDSVVRFELRHVQWSKHNHIEAWYLKAHKDDIAQDPKLERVTCIVYNT